MAATSLLHQKDYRHGYHHLPSKTSEYTIYNQQIFPYSRYVLHGLSDGSEPDMSIIWKVFWKDEFDLLLFFLLHDWVILLLYPSQLLYCFLHNEAPSWTSQSHFPELFMLYFCFLLSPKCILDHHLWFQNKRTGELVPTDSSFPNGTLMIQIHPT